MHLPSSFRENLVDDLDEYLDAYGSEPDAEAVANYVIELLEAFADESGHDDLVVDLEEAGALDDSLQEVLEAEMSSNDEFEYTGEEVVSLLERVCALEWESDEEGEEEEEAEEEEEDLL